AAKRSQPFLARKAHVDRQLAHTLSQDAELLEGDAVALRVPRLDVRPSQQLEQLFVPAFGAGYRVREGGMQDLGLFGEFLEIVGLGLVARKDQERRVVVALGGLVQDKGGVGQLIAAGEISTAVPELRGTAKPVAKVDLPELQASRGLERLGRREIVAFGGVQQDALVQNVDEEILAQANLAIELLEVVHDE